MKPRTLVIFGILGVGVAVFAILQAKKAQAMRLFEKIMFSLSGIGDVGMANGGLWLKLHFAMTNPTAEDFYVNTNGAIQVKVMRMYLFGEQIGYATIPDFYQLDLRSGQTAILRDVRIEISPIFLGTKIYDSIMKNKKNWANYTELLTKLSFEIDIDALGQIYTLKQSFS